MYDSIINIRLCQLHVHLCCCDCKELPNMCTGTHTKKEQSVRIIKMNPLMKLL